MRMSLEKWVEYGWLRREPTSPGEIRDPLGIVERSLADSKVEAVSTDLRFIAAFMPLSVLQQLRCGRRVIARSLRPVITSRGSRCEEEPSCWSSIHGSAYTRRAVRQPLGIPFAPTGW